MSVYVTDASVAVKWYVPEIHSDEALRLLEPGNELHVPDLMQAEVGNILWKKTRRGELTPSEARRVIRAILVVPLQVHATSSLLEGALDIALRADRTVYDALYVALAVALDVPLVTADRRLFQALARSTLRRHVTWVEDVPQAG
jgi:predicted nucleic acid-binding protein